MKLANKCGFIYFSKLHFNYVELCRLQSINCKIKNHYFSSGFLFCNYTLNHNKGHYTFAERLTVRLLF